MYSTSDNWQSRYTCMCTFSGESYEIFIYNSLELLKHYNSHQGYHDQTYIGYDQTITLDGNKQFLI